MLEDKIQKPGDYLFWFSLGGNLMDQRGGDGWVIEEFKSSRWGAGKNFPNFEMLDAKIASASNKIIQNSHFKKKVSLEEQKAQKEDPFLRGRQIAFMICDNFRVTDAHDTVLDYADFFSITLRIKSLIREETKVYCRWQELHRMMFWKACTNWEYESLINSKMYWNCTTWKSIRKYRCTTIKNWRRWWREVEIRNFDCEIFDARHEKIETSSVVKSHRGLSGVEGGKCLLPVERIRAVFEGRPMQFPAWE